MPNLPVPSLVRVYFADRGAEYTYYNDAFDLREGDIVYVEGKLEGVCGQVTGVNRNFRIHLSDYKRVVGRADRLVNFPQIVHRRFFPPHKRCSAAQSPGPA